MTYHRLVFQGTSPLCSIPLQCQVCAQLNTPLPVACISTIVHLYNPYSHIGLCAPINLHRRPNSPYAPLCPQLPQGPFSNDRVSFYPARFCTDKGVACSYTVTPSDLVPCDAFFSLSTKRYHTCFASIRRCGPLYVLIILSLHATVLSMHPACKRIRVTTRMGDKIFMDV